MQGRVHHQLHWAVLLVLCVTFGRPGFAANVTSTNLTIKHIVDNLFNDSYYDPTIRPLYDLGEAVHVEVDLMLNTLGPVTERDMQMSASFYLRQQWHDPRLAFSGMNTSILLNYRHEDSIWVPDTYFSQSKNEQSYEVTVPNILIRISPDGTILFSQRLAVTFQCLMDLHKFPLDYQICCIRLESYGHTTEDMTFSWSSQRKSLEILDNAHLPDFTVKEITTHDCTAAYETGAFPCLEARLTLQRELGFYMTQTYIPSILIVSLSWVSFWLDPQAVPARISVGLLTVLTITTQSSGARSELPRVSYTKSIDVWMAMCLVFVFAAYMEYALVTICSRRHRKSRFSVLHTGVKPGATTQAQPNDAKGSTSTHLPEDSLPENNNLDLKRPSQPAAMSKTESCSSFNCTRTRCSIESGQARDYGRVVDIWSRYLFPLAFLVFNICYWLYYITVPDSVKKL